MRILFIGLLALSLVTPAHGQQISPAAFTVGNAADATMVAFPADSARKLSLGTHALAGSLIGMLVLGGAVAIGMLVEGTECICNPIMIAVPVLSVGAVAGALTGMVVYAGRKAHARNARAR
jgi:hypothetical protein